LLGREQSSLLRKDHPRKPPPIGDDLAVGVVAKVVAILGCKLVSPLCGQIVEPVVVFLGETVVNRSRPEYRPRRPCRPN
jgi:hypothetical protein